ncbi:hypothetical protein H6P81_016899 [Aristolochia fimbriata]|uniref:Uncharacterized protein n=1 Tax=Aristolochia fimbriata TaxID=158543 RepID=A0AAV7DWM6_ARIFI|nr:hypothetical protein H6P81_016899 [Aristolochia fimbriata]
MVSEEQQLTWVGNFSIAAYVVCGDFQRRKIKEQQSTMECEGVKRGAEMANLPQTQISTAAEYRHSPNSEENSDRRVHGLQLQFPLLSYGFSKDEGRRRREKYRRLKAEKLKQETRTFCHLTGFKKSSSDRWEFQHEKFRRGGRDVLVEINRRKCAPSMFPSFLEAGDRDNTSAETSHLLEENKTLQRQNSALLLEIAHFKALETELMGCLSQCTSTNQTGNSSSSGGSYGGNNTER